MAFTRARRRRATSLRPERDRHAIVGLSGWLFADLLLGLAVIFLVVEAKSVVAPEPPPPGDAKRPTVELTLRTEADGSEEGIPVFQEGSIKELKGGVEIDLKYDEKVYNFEGLEQAIEENIRGEARGWQVRVEKVDNLDKADVGQTFRLRLFFIAGFTEGDVNIRVPEGTSLDMSNNPSKESNSLSLIVRSTPAVTIDAANAIKLTIHNVGESELCTRSREVTTQGLARRIRALASFERGGATGKWVREARSPMQWIQDQYQDRAKIGFALIFGGDPDGRGIRRATNWQPCVFGALDELGLLGSESDSTSSRPVRLFRDGVAPAQTLAIELYFFIDADSDTR
jgi:hypothetical protein